ncbi:MAG: calcium-binding protein [Nostoc sp.]
MTGSKLTGTAGADTLFGTTGNNIIDGKAGNDILTGNGSQDKFIIRRGDGNDIITDFGGVGKGTNPSATVINQLDTLQFIGSGLTARNLQLTQNANNLELTFSDAASTKVNLQNFQLENLDNLPANGSQSATGNILFDGQSSITDSFDVFNANSSQTTIFNKNTVTFLNDLSNNVSGFDNSDDVINGQGGNDRIDGKSGDDILRGSAGNDTLIGGAGNDTLRDYQGNNALIGDIGEDYLNVDTSTGDNTLNGGIGDDTLDARATSGNNFLSGGDGNDYLSASFLPIGGYNYIVSSSNNTLDGGAGNDYLDAKSPSGDNLLSGGNGNDYLSTSSVVTYKGEPNYISSGNNTINGGAGDDTLKAEGASGNNLLSGGNGNDYLDISSIPIYYNSIFLSSGNNTINGGAGDDTLKAEGTSGNNLLSGGNGNDYLDISSISIYYNSIFLSSGNNTLNGGAGDDTFRAKDSTGNNFLFGDDGNDSFYLSLENQTVDGGKGDDLLSVDYSYYSNSTGGITTTFNATTNTGSITVGTYRVSYKNIEKLNISGTADDDFIVGSNGNDTLSTGNGGKETSNGNDTPSPSKGGKDTIDGGKGDDVLSADYSDATSKITTTFNATTNTGLITAGTYQVNYKNIERLNITGTAYDDNILGNNGNDTLSTGSGGNDTINSGQGDDILSVDYDINTTGITTTYNTTTNAGVITAGSNRVSYKNIERLDISGTVSDDYIIGNDGNDTLSGGSFDGNDTIIGGAGNDVLIGGQGNDILTGGGGNDLLYGGAGSDILTGDNGNDIFAFAAGEGTDTITDFTKSLSCNNLASFELEMPSQ